MAYPRPYPTPTRAAKAKRKAVTTKSDVLLWGGRADVNDASTSRMPSTSRITSLSSTSGGRLTTSLLSSHQMPLLVFLIILLISTPFRLIMFSCFGWPWARFFKISSQPQLWLHFPCSSSCGDRPVSRWLLRAQGESHQK